MPRRATRKPLKPPARKKLSLSASQIRASTNQDIGALTRARQNATTASKKLTKTLRRRDIPAAQSDLRRFKADSDLAVKIGKSAVDAVKFERSLIGGPKRQRRLAR